ncbi:MAG: hypothetical protein ACFCVD_03665 [Nodosilinea sp.]
MANGFASAKDSVNQRRAQPPLPPPTVSAGASKHRLLVGQVKVFLTLTLN